MDAFVDGSALFVVSGHRDAAHLVYLGLHALQHRGESGVALASSDGDLVRSWRGEGWVSQALGGAALGELSGSAACGLVWGRPGRSADGPTHLGPSVPSPPGLVFGRYRFGQAAAAMSGRFTNGERLRRELQADGALFHSGADAELLLHLIAQSGQGTFVNRLVDALWRVKGAYSLVVMSEDRVVVVRDPSGFRPLVVGRLGDAILVASEDAAIRFAGGRFVREVEPGEMLILEGAQELAVHPFASAPPYRCVHEYVSLSRPDAATFGKSVFAARVSLGQRLARLHPCGQADIVVALPGAEPHATGFAEEAGLPWMPGLLRGPYASIHLEEPSSGIPDFGTRAQLQAVPSVVEGRRVCMVAASVATEGPLRKAARLLRAAGALEVHIRVASPWVERGCRYGVAGPSDDQLLDRAFAGFAAQMGVQSLEFLTLDALHEAVAMDGRCDACFSGQFPIVPEEVDEQLPLFSASDEDFAES